MKKYAYFGYDFFDAINDVAISAGYSLISVFSIKSDNLKYNFNSKTVDRAVSLGLSVRTDRPTGSDLEKLRDMGCDVILVAGYPYRVPIEVVPNIVAVNLHPTLLPQGRGPWPLPWIILNQLETSGVTLQKLAASFDSGDIISQSSFSVSETETLESLSCKVQLHGKRLVRDFMINPEAGLQNATAQGQSTYWPQPALQDRTIDWSMPVDKICRIIRAFGKFDSCANFDGKDWIIQDATCWAEFHNEVVGEVVHKTNTEIVVAAKDGYVCIRYFSIDL